MKVGEVRRVQATTATPSVKARVEEAGSGSSFSNVFDQAQDQQLREELQKKMKEIDSAADGLRKDINADSLWDYRSRVKEFVEIISTRLYHVRGRGVLQTMKVIDTVNAELEELTRIAMEGQKNILRVVQKIEEIRGLLLDLYS
ncbi:MAG: YaaR family protein [Nitrospirae bacterium]|nr:YaaR family protein [Nitrospirota bacterium]